MTEYWVSQGNKWCDFCKIFISNNPTSIRNHELGQRHKDSVAKRLVTMRQEKAAKEKEQKEAARALEQIETKAKRSYEKDISAFKDARVSNANAFVAQEDDQGTVNAEEDWEYDSSSGYYCHKTNGCFYDPNSGFYYTDALGRWVTREEAFAAAQTSSNAAPKKPIFKKPSVGSESRSVSENKGGTQSQNVAAATGLVVSAPLNPTRTVKGAPSSLTLNKRKRQDGKPKILSEEEKAAIKAREAARKRVEEREKPLLGLYRQ
ncbi:zinc finger protein ZOP1 [Rhododendron vialii]|uniref:zinc finger protein ZOP1 n=1 Tax=Rhododendron vialii TaxID=182163 RepID=UPI00265EC332|nr:zinc finger protein ZOP1 [Rhododendron vialii]